jgi:hypothetical protein
MPYQGCDLDDRPKFNVAIIFEDGAAGKHWNIYARWPTGKELAFTPTRFLICQQTRRDPIVSTWTHGGQASKMSHFSTTRTLSDFPLRSARCYAVQSFVGAGMSFSNLSSCSKFEGNGWGRSAIRLLFRAKRLVLPGRCSRGPGHGGRKSRSSGLGKGSDRSSRSRTRLWRLSPL